MKFNKVCKKVLAYTLTSAMTMGFFAVSNINLTTAWATSDLEAEANVYTLSGTGNTIASGEKVTLSDDTSIVTGTGDFALTVGTGTLELAANKTLTVKQASEGAAICTIAAGSSAVAFGNGTKFVKAGITAGTITGGTITGGTVDGAVVDGAVLENCTAATSLTVSSGKATTIKGDFTGSSLSLTGPGTFNFDKATVKGSITGATAPIVKGNLKASNLTIDGQVAAGSDATITLKSGVNTIDATSNSGAGGDPAYAPNSNFDKLTLVCDPEFKGSTTDNRATIKVYNGNVASLEADGAYIKSHDLIGLKYSSDNEDVLVKAMIAGNVVPSVNGSAECTLTGGYGAFLKGGYYTVGMYDLDYAKDGNNMTITLNAKGNKYDKTSYTVPVKTEIPYVVGTPINSSTTLGDNYVLDLSKVPTAALGNDWGKTVAKRCVTTLAADGAAGTTGTTVFTGDGDSNRNVTEYTLRTTIAKRDISKAQVNGLKNYGLTESGITDGSSSASAVGLPKDFISIELPDQANCFKTAPNGSTVKLVYVRADGLIANVALSGVVKSVDVLPSTVGDYNVTIEGDGENYTGSKTLQYSIVNEQDSTTYNGEKQSPSITGAVSYSIDGTNYTTTAPSYTDAGTYRLNYKNSDGEVKTAVYVINPLPVSAKWSVYADGATPVSYKYDGKAKTRTVTGVTGSADQNILDLFDLNGVLYTYGKDGKAVDSCLNVGSYKVKAIADRTKNKNFNLANSEANLSITASAATVTSAKEYVFYDDKADHKIDKVTINAPEGSYKVTYSTTETGTYSETIPTFNTEGTYKVYYKVALDSDYAGTEPINVTIDSTTKGYATLTIKPALSMKRTDDTKSTVTYTGKAFPITADAYSGTDKVTDVKVVFYIDKGDDQYTKITDGIKAVGTYPIVYAFEKDGVALTGKKYMGTITIKAAPKKNISKATASAKAVTYNGKNQVPVVTVKYGKTALKNGTDYTINSAKRINAGKYTVVITGKGNYTGTKKITFTINKRNVKYATIKKAYKKVKGKKVLKSYTVYYGKTKLVIKKNFKLTNKKVKSGKKYVYKKYVQGIGNYTGYKAF